MEKLMQFPLLIGLSVILLSSCGGIPGGTVLSGPGNSVIELKVEPVYASGQGASWNSYIKDDGSANTCEPGTDTSCVHSAEFFKVEIPEVETCPVPGFTVSDYLGVFNWVCDDSSNPTKIITTGLIKDRGLKDLVTGLGWKSNKVIVKSNGSTIAESSFSVWHVNPVVSLPGTASDTVVELDNSYEDGTVFVLSSDATNNGYNITIEKVSIVTLNNATLTLKIGGALNCNSANGLNDAGNNAKCIIASGSKNFIWIEGDFDGGSNADRGIFLYNTKFSKINSSSVSQTTASGIYLANSSYNRFIGINTSTNSLNGFSIYNSNKNVLSDVTANNNGCDGVYLSDSDDNIISTVTTYSNGGDGVQFYSSDYNTLANLTTSYNMDDGLEIGSGGLPTDYNTFIQVASFFNGVKGLNFDGADHNNLGQVFLTNNGTYGVYFTGTGSYWNSFQNNAIIGNNGLSSADDCFWNLGNFNHILADCTPSIEPPTTVVISHDPANTYVNESSLVRDGEDAFVNGGVCPGSINGIVVVSDFNTGGANTFLVNAIEINNDFIGDEDGLCESGEACIYSPNYGSYQGSGDYTEQTCNFTGGYVINVTMYKYPN